jgi:DNA-binding transcriptional regulator YiaG
MTPLEFQIVRRELAMTQKQLSVVSGISLRAIQYYEGGGRDIPPYIDKLMYCLLKIKIMENKEYYTHDKPTTILNNSKKTIS